MGAFSWSRRTGIRTCVRACWPHVRVGRNASARARRYLASMNTTSGQGDGEPTTQELKHEQEKRESEENRRLAESEQPDEARQHERRSDKAAYLKEKLAERERSERDAERG